MSTVDMRGSVTSYQTTGHCIAERPSDHVAQKLSLLSLNFYLDPIDECQVVHY